MAVQVNGVVKHMKVKPGDCSGCEFKYVLFLHSLSPTFFPLSFFFALRSEKTRRLSIDATK